MSGFHPVASGSIPGIGLRERENKFGKQARKGTGRDGAEERREAYFPHIST